MASATLQPVAPRRLAGEIVDGFQRHRLLILASAIAYQTIAAILPFACFGLGLMGLLQLESLWVEHLAPEVGSRVSSPMFAVINETVSNVLGGKQLFWVTAGLVLAIYEVSGAVRAVMVAMDSIYDAPRRRPWRERVVRSIWLAVVVSVLMLAVLAVLVAGPLLIGSGPASLLLRVPLAALLLGVTIAVLIRYASNVRQPLRWVSFGSALTIVAWLLAAGAYAFYVTHIVSPGSVFGPLAAAFMLIVFVYFSAIVFLAGLLVDASVREEVTT